MRGQIWSMDFTSGTLILTLVLLLFIITWNLIALRWNNANEYRQMQTAAIFAAESLMTTSGEPKSWESLTQIDGSNITTFGLVNGRNEINPMKIEKLVSENATAYGFVKERLGLQKYELGVRILDLDSNTTYYEFGTFAGGLNTTVGFDRMGLLNNTPVIVHIEVWQ